MRESLFAMKTGAIPSSGLFAEECFATAVPLPSILPCREGIHRPQADLIRALLEL